MRKGKTYLITDKHGVGMVVFTTNDPTVVINMPEAQVKDASHLPEDRKAEVRNNPEDFDKHLKKLKKEKPNK